MQRGWARSHTDATTRRPRTLVPSPNSNEVTDIIPFDEFGDLDDPGFRDHAAFDSETLVLQAPELDDLHDTDNLTALPLVFPDEFPAGSTAAGRADAPDFPRRGQHRKPATSAVKGRILIAAMAAGAASAAAYSAISRPDTGSAAPVLAADASPLDGDTTAAQGMKMVTVRPAASTVVHDEELAKGVAFAEERAEREARLQRPLFATPTQGLFTSSFGYRWGALHGGIDLANSIGTPILAVSDGVVVEAGPSAGYGMLVKVRHFDGTVTLYGHVNTTTVDVGERVMAGDQIATMGNRGDSTGPHLHLEVLLNGSSRINPVPWLASRGINVGG
jgi:murein DD-endopeptidase MepM/ murein hydrolase activator NlpD